MADNFFIALEQNLDEIDIMPAGKALAKMMDRIDEITDEIGVTRLGDFIAGGDSGSLMVQDAATNPKAVGLLFAGSSTTAVANPIDQVLSYVGSAVGGTATMVGQ